MKLDYFDTPVTPPTKVVTTEYYANEAYAIKENDYYNFIRYSNGDRIWLKVVDGEYVVTMVCDYTGSIHTGFNKHPFGASKP